MSLENMSPWLRKATVAIEDRRFYQHGGVDYEGIARALWKDIRAGRVVEGGSTITQQLARTLYISNQERTLERKLKEACLAIKLSEAWPKNRILTAYLNHVYYGNRAYGVEAASQTYFSRRARGLNLNQAALLAGLTQAPSAYDPFDSPERALNRRDAVLRAMLGNGSLTRTEYRRAVADRELGLKPGTLYSRIREPYFFSFVREQLVDRYGERRVQTGGLRVLHDDRPAAPAAGGAGDPGHALLPGRPGVGRRVHRSAHGSHPGDDRRDPGAVEQPVQPRRAGTTAGRLDLQDLRAHGGGCSRHRPLVDVVPVGAVPLRGRPTARTTGTCRPTATTTLGPSRSRARRLSSDNTVYARLTLDLGPNRVAGMARSLGVRTPLSPVPSVGLGTIAVSPLDMASAYATLAGEGVYSRPRAITKVELPGGRIDKHWGKSHRKRVIADGTAYEVTQILEENMQSGTGIAAGIGRPAAGKTGTTDDHADAWFCGYTPDLATTVWVGYPSAEIPMESVHGISVAGGTFPAEIWRRFMAPALAATPALSWREPSVWPIWQSWDGTYQHSGGSYDDDYYYSDDSYDYDDSYTPTEPPPPPPPSSPPAASTAAAAAAGTGRASSAPAAGRASSAPPPVEPPPPPPLPRAHAPR